MLKVKKIAAVALTGLVVIGFIMFHGYKKGNNLPYILFPAMNADVLYKITMHNSDTSGLRFGEPKQFYHILLKANQAYRFETIVGWLGMEAKLYGNGRKIDELNCGYNARCHFSVKQDKDTWALLRLSGYGDALDTPFTFEVRRTNELYDRGTPAARSESIQPLPLPAINIGTVYNGRFSSRDVPSREDGSGSSQSYLVELKAGQKVYINATSVLRDLRLQISDFMDMRERAREGGHDVCFAPTAPKNGMYTIDIYTYDELNKEHPEADNFTLKVSNSPDKEKDCHPGI